MNTGCCGSRRIQIVARQLAAFLGLGVVVLEADDPVAGRRLGGALADGVLNIRDGAEVAIHPSQVPDAGVGRVRMRIDEAGHDGLAANVELADAGF